MKELHNQWVESKDDEIHKGGILIIQICDRIVNLS